MSMSREEFMTYCRNRPKFDPDRFLPYEGTWVAFNKEGTEIILNSAASEDDLWEQLKARGLDPFDHPIEYVPGPGDVFDREVIVSRGNPVATDVPVTGTDQSRSAG
jgi:hypothetical protein